MNETEIFEELDKLRKKDKREYIKYLFSPSLNNIRQKVNIRDWIDIFEYAFDDDDVEIIKNVLNGLMTSNTIEEITHNFIKFYMFRAICNLPSLNAAYVLYEFCDKYYTYPLRNLNKYCEIQETMKSFKLFTFVSDYYYKYNVPMNLSSDIIHIIYFTLFTDKYKVMHYAYYLYSHRYLYITPPRHYKMSFKQTNLYLSLLRYCNCDFECNNFTYIMNNILYSNCHHENIYDISYTIILV